VIDRAFYARPVLEVAPDLIGCVVRHGEAAGIIVETEAYHRTEPASHAWAGLTARTKPLFGPPGVAYIYFSYGIHSLLNAVCDAEESGAAVLIRALEPLEGIEVMRARRGVARDADLCNGPGKLTQALGIGLELNGTSLVDGPIRIEPRAPGWEAPDIAIGRRIGITKAVDLDWRFCARGNRNVSRPWPAAERSAAA
jgi:DNA-3-methyladenine glycosylase